VSGGREFAAVFVYEVPLVQLLDRGFLRRVAEGTYRFFELREGSGGEYVFTKNVVDDVARV
jgi:predicted transcriptional regulator of viral defense system